MKPRILIVAADASLRAMLARWLLAAGYAVELAETPKRAREVAADADISLTLLAPDGLGAEAAEIARSFTDTAPVMFIGARPGPAFSANAALSTPLREDEVLAQVRDALSVGSSAEPPSAPQALRFEGYTLDVAGRSVIDANGAELSLTRSEFSLLLAFAGAPGRLLSRDELRQAVAGRGAEPDDRSVDVLVSRLRRKIEPDPKAPRLIVTLPGEGYKFTAKPQATAAPREVQHAVELAPLAPPEQPLPLVPAPTAAVAAVTPSAPVPSRGPLRIAALGGAAAGVMVGLAIGLWYSGFGSLFAPAVSAQRFDANLVPMVFDSTRVQLAEYQHEPGAKAIAISREGWGMSFGAADAETAKNEAIGRCKERDKTGFCRIYAAGENVAWAKSALPLPLPADIRQDLTDAPLTADALEKLWRMIWGVAPPQPFNNYVSKAEHKALAVAIASAYMASVRPTRAEAIRIAIERCSDAARTACLLLSVDGRLTVAVPQSRRLVAPFTLAGELTMSEAERARVAEIYAGKDWRALAKGGSEHWYAVSGLASETAAVDAALKACRDAEADCALYAIGNFRVGEKIEPQSGG